MSGHEGGNRSNARTPEELEILFEDALMMGDHATLAELFDPRAVLDTGSDCPMRGPGDIVRCALAAWQGTSPYVANPQRVLQVRDLALIVTEQGVNVACRRDGAWRYVIVFQSP